VSGGIAGEPRGAGLPPDCGPGDPGRRQLVFHRTPDLAILVGGVVEEAARAGINSATVGGPVEVPAGLRADRSWHGAARQPVICAALGWLQGPEL
jgi:hypothetical protein